MKNESTRAIGRKFEEIARLYLLSQGYEILEQNYYCSSGEIDLITEYDTELIFVEVKSIKSSSKMEIWETVSQTKRQRLANSIDDWLNKNDSQHRSWSLDFVGIVWDSTSNYNLEHIKNI